MQEFGVLQGRASQARTGLEETHAVRIEAKVAHHEQHGVFTPSPFDGNLSIVLDDFFSVTSAGAGTGSRIYSPDEDFTERPEELLGKRHFDQFALIFKAVNDLAA